MTKNFVYSKSKGGDLIRTRLIPLILVLALILGAFAGCGNAADSHSDDTTPETQVAPLGANSEKTLGTVENGVYTNKYTGFSVALDEKWTVSDARKLQTLPEDVTELFTDSAILDDMEKYPTVMDLNAENNESYCSINVLYQKMDMATQLSCAAITEKEYVEALLSQEDLLESTYADAGFSDVFAEVVQVEFAGHTRTALLFSCLLENGMPYFFMQLFYHQLGTYSVTVTLGSFINDYTGDLLKMFKPL